jgi:glutamyl-tRNA synthetase
MSAPPDATPARSARDATSRVVGRLAPSPTGLLHLGHARTFLIAWWSARSQHGKLVLRIEDLDAPRASQRFSDALLRDLAWLGLDWDGAVSVQSTHLERFDGAVRELLERGAAYPCVCTRGELRTAQNAPHAGDHEPRYPGTCRDRFVSLEEAERVSGRPAGVRLRVPEGAITLHDRIAGDVSFDVQASVGDFLIARRGGAPAYQLAVVVDDAAQGVTEVVRGADLLPSAARQWHVQRALGLETPSLAHVALVTDSAGERLAKHTDALSLSELRERGTDARAVVRWAAESAGLPLDAPVTPAEALREFRFTPALAEPARIDAKTLAALSPHDQG